jgi:hypothetical protein
MALDTCLVELVRQANESDRGKVEPGLFCTTWYSHIDLVRNLGRNSMERQGGNEADHALWHPACDGGKVRVAKLRQVGKPLQPAADLVQPSGLPEAVENARMDTKSERTGCAQHAAVFFEDGLGFTPSFGVVHGG